MASEWIFQKKGDGRLDTSCTGTRLPIYRVRISSWISSWIFELDFRVGFSSWIFELGFRVGFSSWIFELGFFGGIFLAVFLMGFSINFQWFYTTYFVSGVAHRLEVFSRWKRTERIAGLIYSSISFVILFLTGNNSLHFNECF